MKNPAVLVIAICCLIGCTRSSSSSPSSLGPSTSSSIAGTWKLAYITGYSIYTSGDTILDTTTFTFDTISRIYAVYTTNHDTIWGGTHDTTTRDTTSAYVSYETWTITDSGTYTIAEAYTRSTGPRPRVADTTTGIWGFLNDNINDNEIMLGTGTSSYVADFSLISSVSNNIYEIEQLNSTTLVLGIVYTYSDSTSGDQKTNIAITFTK